MKTLMIIALALVLSSGVLGQDRPRENQRVQQDVTLEKLSIVPDAIDFQGRLQDALGSPVNGTLSIAFKFFNVEAGGTPVWSETQSAVEVIDGLFQVRLGSMNPIHPDLFIDGETLWLAIQIDGEAEMSPRIHFASTGYAMKTFERDPTWIGNANPEDPISRLGNVGIGLSDPPAKLSVGGVGSNPAIPGSTSVGLLSLRNQAYEAIDIGKMEVSPYTGWIQAGYNQVEADPLSLNPLGGYVGIGTNTPTQLLDVSGTFRLRGHLFDYNNTSGTSGQVLTRDASGVLWQTPVTGPWLISGSDIFFSAGKVGIGTIPGGDQRQFQVHTENYQAIAGINNSDVYATLYAQNDGTGPAADFRDRIRILDGTQGAGKILTSDANGFSSWQTPASSPWQVNGDNIFYNSGKVGIGGDPGTSFRQLQVFGVSNIGIYTSNTSSTYATLFAENLSSTGGTAARFQAPNGTAATFVGPIHIADGTQGTGKVLTSDVNGYASWQTPTPSPWLSNGSNIYFDAGNVGIGGANNTSIARLLVKTTGSEVLGLESSTASFWLAFYNSGVRKGILWVSGNTLNLRSDEGDVAIKTSGNNTRLTIEDDGDISTPITGADKNIVPVAFGYVNQLGQLNEAISTSNVSSSRTGSTGTYNYIVTISGVATSSFIALVTPGGTYNSYPRVTYTGNTFVVNFMSHAGNEGQANNFSFVVFAP
ncbi:MAG: hypothetical protein V2I46_12885 [Bacteroides sp.]|jgi:hypothetical protein|nr:hypothetical protein [Bacteroides sp.]